MSAAIVFGQAARTATLVGTVTDPSGAVIAGAEVEAIAVATNLVSKGVTNEQGSYYIPFLAVGNYSLTVESKGFKKFNQKGLQLQAGETPRVDVRLDVGSVTETVEVTAAVPLLQTETSLVSQTFDAAVLNQIPVLQMKAQRILYYMVGVSSRGANSSVLGQSINQLGFTLDGISAKTSIRDAVGDTNSSVQPAMDALSEAKTYTTGAPAEIGHVAGGMIAYTFKSGANGLHGSAEDRYMNKSMVHRSYLELAPRVNPFTFHQIQSTLSGPVIIPGLYNGKNKTFFLFGFGRHHEKANDPQTQTVPDANMLAGNFSFPQATGGGFPIYDPRSLVLNGTTWTSTPFTGNIIPSSQINIVAKNFLALEPWKPATNPVSTTYSRSGPSNNWDGYTTYRSYRSRYDIKFDHQISAADKFFIRESFNRHRQTGRVTASLNNLLLDSSGFGFGRPEPIDQQNWAFSEYHTFSPTLLNEVRLGFNRRVDIITPPTAGQGWGQKLGIPNISPANFPGLNVGMGIGPGSFSRSLNEDITFQNNVTLVKSTMTIKFGYEFIRTRENNVASTNASGTFTFGGTALPNVTNTGNSFANFLIGGVTSASFTTLLANELPRWSSHAGYVQTDWKATRNVTLNLGLRYSIETPFQTKRGDKSVFNPDLTDSLTGLKGAITHPLGGAYKYDKNNFQPRAGVAWHFSKKLVFRGSWGLITQDYLGTAGREEYTSSYNVTQPVGDVRPIFYINQGPPNQTPVIKADGTSPFLTTSNTYTGRNTSFFASDLYTPYVMNWSAGFQVDLGRNWVQETIYQGSAGVGNIGGVNINQLPKSIYDSTDQVFLNTVRLAAQNYRPYFNYGTITMNGNSGHSTYHGLVARVEKRYSEGLTLNFNYTWSKNLSGTAGDGWQYYDWNLTKSPTSFDTKHRFIIMPTYEIPVGRGRKFANGGGWKDPIIGGWNISLIYSILSGPPVTFSYAGSTVNYLPGGPSRPDQISQDVVTKNWEIGPNRYNQAQQNPYFIQEAFAIPAAYRPGTLGAGTARGLWMYWPQWTLSKTFTIHEKIKFSVRLDGNNIPVAAQYTTPTTTVNYATAVGQRTFGRFAAGGVNFSSQGTSNGNLVFGTRLVF
jgi:hypothetical protein